MLWKLYYRTEGRINKLTFVNGRRNFYFYSFQSLFCSGSIAIIKGCYWMIELIKKGVMNLKDENKFFFYSLKIIKEKKTEEIFIRMEIHCVINK